MRVEVRIICKEEKVETPSIVEWIECSNVGIGFVFIAGSDREV